MKIKNFGKNIALSIMVSMVLSGSLYGNNFMSILDVEKQIKAIDDAKAQHSNEPIVLEQLKFLAAKIEDTGSILGKYDAVNQQLEKNSKNIKKLEKLYNTVISNPKYAGELKKYGEQLNMAVSFKRKLEVNNKALINNIKKMKKMGGILTKGLNAYDLGNKIGKLAADLESNNATVLDGINFALDISKATVGLIPLAGTLFDVADAVVYGIDKGADFVGENKRDESLSDSDDMQKQLTYLNNRVRIQASKYAKEGISEDKLVDNYKNNVQNTINYIKNTYEKKSQGGLFDAILTDNATKKEYERTISTLEKMLDNNSGRLATIKEQYNDYKNVYSAINDEKQNSELILRNAKELALKINVETIRKELIKDKIDSNKNTLTKLKLKDKKIQDKLESINEKEERIKGKRNQLSDVTRSMNNDKRTMEDNKLTKKEKLLIEAQKILYSRGNKGIKVVIAWAGLSKSKKKRLASIYKELGIITTTDDGNIIKNVAKPSLAMAKYINKNNYKINRLKNQQHNYLSAYSWSQGTKNTWINLVKDIKKLTNEIETSKDYIDSLEKDKSVLLSQIEDTSDFNNEEKTNLTQNTNLSQDTNAITPLTGYIDASKSSLYTSVRSGIVVTESSGNLDTLSLGVGSNPLLNSGTFSKKPDNGYAYVSWGEWSSSNVKYFDYQGNIQNLGDMGETNNVIYYGQRTAVNDIPTTGSAVFNGEAIGYIKSTDTAVNGTVQILANFADSSISGSININNFANTNINGQIGGIYTGDSAAYSKTIDGSLSGTNVASGSTMNAQFYGSGAAEMGGIWKIIKTDTQEASGVFRAKK